MEIFFFVGYWYAKELKFLFFFQGREELLIVSTEGLLNGVYFGSCYKYRGCGVDEVLIG